jgi:uncharacterized protein involved in exopolysaccharide biosynthesis
MTDAPVDRTAAKPPKKRSIEEILILVWKERKRIFVVSLIAGVLTLLVNFLLLDLYYKATASLLPETDKNKLGGLSQFSGLAQLAGVGVPGSEISRLYPIIVMSETVLRPVIEKQYQTKEFPQPVDLVQYFELEKDTRDENMDEALRVLKNLMTTTYETKTSTVTITLEMKEPLLAAEVLNAIIGELDRFMRVKKITTASEQARWISSRLTEVEKELRLAEDSLKTFRERNRRVADSPTLLLQQVRLIREGDVKSAIYVELKKQHELAKIEEIKNITIVNVLDGARAPVRKERPKRATNAALAFLLTFAGMSTWYAMLPVYGGKVSAFVKGVRGG